MRFQVSSRPEALETFTSNMYKDEKTNQYVAGFPRINDTPPILEKLDSNFRLVLAKVKDTTFNISPLRLLFMLFLCFVAICPNLTLDQICPVLIPAKSSIAHKSC